MPNTSNLAMPDPEGIDAIIDSVVAHPDRAEHAKDLLRKTIAKRKTILSFPASAQGAVDDDDMWDNVPV